MITSIDGQPGIALIGMSAGHIDHPDGTKTLVFIDPPSGLQFHIPMTDEQMDAIYQQWTGGKKVIIAGAHQIPIDRVNGSG